MSSNVGKIIYGYCGGKFGNVYPDARRIEAEGYDWIVARNIDDEFAYPEFARFENENQKEGYIAEWAKKEE